MKRERDPTQAEFDRLLNWLDADRDAAAGRYETVHYRLIRIFVSRGCPDAERLADEVMNRVAVRIDQIVRTYEGEPVRCFLGFADKVFLEYRREIPLAQVPQPTASSDELEQEDRCLTQCMERLADTDRELVLRYHQDEKRAKIDHRKKLAEEWGMTVNALRIRVHRLCRQLRQCIEPCLEQSLVH